MRLVRGYIAFQATIIAATHRVRVSISCDNDHDQNNLVMKGFASAYRLVVCHSGKSGQEELRAAPWRQGQRPWRSAPD